MSILIKMEMPKNCGECPIYDGEYLRCNITNTEPWQGHEDDDVVPIPSDCPLIEVPPHGDLIDRKALCEDIEQSVVFSARSQKQNAEIRGAFKVYDRIKVAPTIIEAETCNNSENTCNKTEDDAVNTSFPCDTCRFNPPSSCDGKPCTMCDTSNPLTNCYQKARVKMEVIDKKPVPIYEVECFECKSKLQYKKSEVSNCFITCPVCGISLMVTAISPVGYESEE